MNPFISCVYGGPPLQAPLSSFRSTWLAVVPHIHISKPRGVYSSDQCADEDRRSFWTKSIKTLNGYEVPFLRRTGICALFSGLFARIGGYIHLCISKWERHDAPVGHMVWWRLTWACIALRECINCCSYLCRLLSGFNMWKHSKHVFIYWRMFGWRRWDCVVLSWICKERQNLFAQTSWSDTRHGILSFLCRAERCDGFAPFPLVVFSY